MNFPAGNIEGLLVGSDPDSFYTYPVAAAEFDLAGQTMAGNLRHSGQTTLADIRTPAYRKKEDIVLNRQAVSIVGSEDLDYLADSLDINEELAFDGLIRRFRSDSEAKVPTGPDYGSTLEQATEVPGALRRLFLAQCLGANMIVSDFEGTDIVPDFRSLSRGVDVGSFDAETCKFTPDGATIMITRPNAPCSPPGKLIEAMYGLPGRDRAKDFVRLGQGRRGFVGMVSKGGQMAIGQSLRFIPYGE
ncbi:MAG TPA: hypothetical protein VLG16_02960 [Candidatus Saccharimonadales bacterium]|nr:hypothetical protein [Candidatus Saccharimonadales bacterium]